MEQFWPNLPKWVKITVSVFAVVSTIVGLAGAPDDIKRWYAWLESGVPWWVFLVASAFLLLAAWGPSVWSYASVGSLTRRFRTLPPTPSPAELAKLQKARERAMKNDPLNTAVGKVPSPEEEIHRKRELDGLYAENKKLRAKLEESTNEQAMFPGHMDLESAHPIAEQIQQARHVDGIWLTGQVVFQLDDAAIRGTVRRVILPAPDSPLLQEISRWTTIPYGTADLEVQKSTERAVRLGVEVKWLRDFPGLTLLLADPGDESGYAHLETLLPYTDPGYRPIQRIERTRESVVFDRVVKMFDRLWERAESPTPRTATEPTPPKEREAIERVRVLWRSHAKHTSWSALKLFVHLKNDLENHTSLALLLQGPFDELQESRENMRVLVHNETSATLAEICQGFGEFHLRYRNVVDWIHRIEERENIEITSEPYTRSYNEWATRKAAFRDKLDDIIMRSDATELRKGLADYGANLPEYD